MLGSTESKVYAEDFPKRRLPDGRPVTSLNALIEYLTWLGGEEAKAGPGPKHAKVVFFPLETGRKSKVDQFATLRLDACPVAGGNPAVQWQKRRRLFEAEVHSDCSFYTRLAGRQALSDSCFSATFRHDGVSDSWQMLKQSEVR